MMGVWTDVDGDLVQGTTADVLWTWRVYEFFGMVTVAHTQHPPVFMSKNWILY